ncbi:MAG TPA: hypothetical protein VMR52_06280 [Dehalococcoidia bacterium]|nr:hypothetical protein [Dehalococcoidia bacterium]
MLRPIALVLVSAALATAVIACGDDDDDTVGSPSPSTPTPTATFGDGRTSPPTASVTDAAGDDGDDKTPPPGNGDGDDDDDDGPAPTAPGAVPTAPPPATEGTPAPEALSSIVAEYEGQNILNHDCQYSPNTAQIDCGDRGIYAPDPPPVGQDITCTLWLLADEPVLINCFGIGPPNSFWYDISE